MMIFESDCVCMYGMVVLASLQFPALPITMSRANTIPILFLLEVCARLVKSATLTSTQSELQESV
jgi:hypothetical protein